MVRNNRNCNLISTDELMLGVMQLSFNSITRRR